MPHSTTTTSRAMLYHFMANFFLANIGVSLLISLNYFSLLPNFQAIATSLPELTFTWFFILISLITQLSLVFILGFSIIAISNLFLPRKWIVLPLTILISAAILFGLIGDNIAYKLFHMHYAAVGWEIFQAHALSQVITLGYMEIIELLVAAIFLISVESFIAWMVWRRIKHHPMRIFSKLLLVMIVCSILLSYSINYLAHNKISALSNNKRLLVLKATRVLPYYEELYQLLIPSSDQSLYFNNANQALAFSPYNNNQPLDYPKHNLQCGPIKKPLNIVVIAIDTWRFDAMNAEVTPAIYDFAQANTQFKNHWSGGNSTKAGLFSLFYGLPGNYWDAFLQQQRGSLFVKQLLNDNYKVSVFSSAALNFPAFDQTIFKDVKSLTIHTPGDNTIARDQAITKNFQTFLSNRNKQQPFFSFLFYDAVHNYCEPGKLPQYPFKPSREVCNRIVLNINDDPQPYLNRYLNTAHFVDNEVKQVLAAIKQQGLLKNTIVVITADHGEEINDKQSGYWQHASAYTPYQLHVPFIVYWPDKKPTQYEHYTTHYDFVPTIMTQVLNCQNIIKDYAIGASLFDKVQRPVLIASSYADFAVISKNQIARIYPGGDYSVDDVAGHPIEKKVLSLKPLQLAFNFMQDYFKQE